jgi:LacI family transcriptional regulator
VAKRTVTIRDVAERANVSVTTVSHVLNGNDQHVGAEKRARVLAVMEELQYRPNAIARSMIKRKTATIALVISEVDNALFVPVVGGVEEVLRAQGYHIVLASAPDVASEIEAIETLRAQQVDGLIFMSLSIATPIDHLVRLKEEGVPFVVINRYLADPDINQVLLDDWGAGYQATGHLLSLGHTRVATISGPIYNDPPRRSATARHRGYLQALEERGVAARPEWTVVGYYTYEGGYQAARQLFDQMSREGQRPTALFVASDVMAMGALKALADANVRVPEDVALIAIGDPPFAPYSVPALSTLSLPVIEAGRISARLVLDWLGGQRPEPAQATTLSFNLIVRESCGANRHN